LAELAPLAKPELLAELATRYVDSATSPAIAGRISADALHS
jgi:hypothetical protein